MYHVQFLISLINLKTVVFSTLTFILFKCLMDHYSRDPRWVKLSNELPGPRIYPIVGTTVSLLIGARAGFGQVFVNYMNTYGPTFRLWIGRHLAVSISDVNDVQAVFTSSNCLEKKQATAIFSTLFGNGLPITTPAEVWKHKRKVCQPFFIKNTILGRVQEMNELNDIYVEKMKKEVDGPEFDLEHYMNDLSFDTIMKTHFNYDVSDEERKQLNICHRLNEAFMRLAFKWFFRFPLLQAVVQWLQPVDVVETKKLVHDFIDRAILNRKSPSWSNETAEVESKTINKENFTYSYISKLYQLKKELNEADLVHSELLTIIMAGSETTGVTMAFCFLALAMHPEIQEKAYQEIHEVFGDDNRPADASDLNKFPYLEQVIKETQRLFTIIPNVLRSVEKDMRIGAHTHPAGTIVMLNIGGIHHNPKIYPHPNRFNPDNFTPEAIKKRHRFSFIPFSAGQRNCIGKEYAEINMKLRLISFLRVFTFHTNVKLEDIKLRAAILESSSIGYPVRVKLRRNIS